jgi:lipopolysaccharide export system protein LptA
MQHGCFSLKNVVNMRTVLIAILFFVPVLLAAQQIGQDTLATGTSQKKKIRILNSDLTIKIESDSGEILRFWHNVEMEHEGVIMRCDSAIMLPTGIFEAFGNTKITSGTTIITGDVMIYSEITGKANVKGRIVHLIDSSSTLRTTEVDFDTETEIGYFEHEGTIVDSFRTLESQKGYYYAKRKEFEFIGQVQSDTKDYVLQSDSMKYNSDTKVFTFHSNTHIWSEKGYLYCDKGWYDSDKNIMFFHRNSYMLTSKQEIFADSIYYEDEGKKGQLYSNVQVTDTAQKTVAMADFADFDMNTENFLMRRNPSIIMYDDKDSVFLRADTLYSVTRKMKIPVTKNDSVAKNDSVDFPEKKPVAKSDSIDFARKKPVVKRDSVDFAKKKPVVKRDSVDFPEKKPVVKNDSVDFAWKKPVAKRDSVDFPEKKPVVKSDSVDFPEKKPVAKSDSVTFPEKISTSDTTLTTSVPDSILPDMPDTMQYVSSVSDSTQYVDSAYKEVFAFKNAKLYRSDFQLKSDSMYFNNLDSIWRIYNDPILWNGKQMQITSDSMKFYIINGDLKYADFNGNAMVVLPEGNLDTTIYFNQVKSKNMKAHFKNRVLNLFEAMGNAQTLSFSLSDFVMNTTEAAVFKIYFESGKVHHISYYDGITGNNNPLFLVREDEIKLPGYRWEIDLRPKSGNDVLNRLLRPSERTVRESLPKPSFPITKRIDALELEINKKD